MAEQGLFKTAVRGFRKEDVLNYIDELLAAQSTERESWEARLQALTEELTAAQVQKAAVEENETLKARVELLEQQIATDAEQLSALSLQLETAQAANQAASESESAAAAQLEESQRTIAALREEKAALEEKLSATDALVDRLKAIGTEFCRQVNSVLPEDKDTTVITAEEAIEKAAFQDAAPKMESWLF